MNPVDRNLLLRVARRLEEQAEESFKSTPANDPRVHESARRRRDRELGDAKDLREYVKRQDEPEVPAP